MVSYLYRLYFNIPKVIKFDIIAKKLHSYFHKITPVWYKKAYFYGVKSFSCSHKAHIWT